MLLSVTGKYSVSKAAGTRGIVAGVFLRFVAPSCVVCTVESTESEVAEVRSPRRTRRAPRMDRGAVGGV